MYAHMSMDSGASESAGASNNYQLITVDNSIMFI